MLNAIRDFTNGVVALQGIWLGGDTFFHSTNKPRFYSGRKINKYASIDQHAFIEFAEFFVKDF